MCLQLCQARRALPAHTTDTSDCSTSALNIRCWHAAPPSRHDPRHPGALGRQRSPPPEPSAAPLRPEAAQLLPDSSHALLHLLALPRRPQLCQLRIQLGLRGARRGARGRWGPCPCRRVRAARTCSCCAGQGCSSPKHSPAALQQARGREACQGSQARQGGGGGDGGGLRHELPAAPGGCPAAAWQPTQTKRSPSTRAAHLALEDELGQAAGGGQWRLQQRPLLRLPAVCPVCDVA
jgi:hypothetical protein